MSQQTAVSKARKSLLGLLVIILGLVGIIAIGVWREGATWTPKLALDLQGGTQIILAPKLVDGQSVTGEQLDQAVEIIRQRIDASGVAEAEITTEGTTNISISIPGTADEATLQRIEASAKLDFRPVLMTGAVTAPAPEAAAAESAEAAEAEAEPVNFEEIPGFYPDPRPTTAYDQAWLTAPLMAEYEAFSCTPEQTQSVSDAPADLPLITCDEFGVTKYILGPVEMSGETISDAVAQVETTQTGATTGQWVVQMTLNSSGTKTFGDISTRMYGQQPPANQFAFVLDGVVISAPEMNGLITDGRPSISGSFTQETAQTLANQLKFGALPIGFTVQSQQDISATLGSNQLQAGLLAGLLGLLLVVVYSMFQYRALGTVTILSLVVAGVLTYLFLTLFSWRQGYRLSLAGVAGIIVAVGFTADSFIVYFERIRDSLRDGFSLDQSVAMGWKKAFRTVLASDGVNFLAALVLFLLAVGSVKGFAFTLGLTTLVDVIVIALFTHPMVTLLSQTKFFSSGHRFSGLDPERLGAVYRGRAQFRAPVITNHGAAKKNKGAAKEAHKRQTIAERKAAAAAEKES